MDDDDQHPSDAHAQDAPSDGAGQDAVGWPGESEQPEPPARLELPVSRSRAFDAFVRDIGAWWPHGRGQRSTLHVEQMAGGAVVERSVTGDESPWGEVIEIEVGSRIRLTYRHAGEAPAIVTATFRDGEHGGTVVEIAHDEWPTDHERRRALAEAWRRAIRRYVDDATAV